jgi:hypothetical protein
LAPAIFTRLVDGQVGLRRRTLRSRCETATTGDQSFGLLVAVSGFLPFWLRA